MLAFLSIGRHLAIGQNLATSPPVQRLHVACSPCFPPWLSLHNCRSKPNTMPALLSLSPPSLLLSKVLLFTPPRTIPKTPNHLPLTPHRTMSYKSSSISHSKHKNSVHIVPGLSQEEASSVAELANKRYSIDDLKRSGVGVAIMWFRNDLRLIDNEALCRAWEASAMVLPVYCLDPRNYGTTHYFGFPKTGALRAQFLIECLTDLRNNLIKRGLNLLVQYGKPEDVLPSIAKAFGVHTVYAHKETCSEELLVERLVCEGLQRVVITQGGLSNQKSVNPKIEFVWGNTMYHIDDLPFNINKLPDVYTQFRKSVESKCGIRGCIKMPVSLGPLPSNGFDEVGGWGTIPSLEHLGLHEKKCERGMRFLGGETAALARVDEYFWKKDLIKVYKDTRNGMVGPDYSTKFSPWLASGSLSARYVHEQVKRYEKERLANDSTYWVLFELIWRDYFRFLSVKYGNSIFRLGGPRKVTNKWSQDQALFESWRDGHTGYPLIDANMKELSTTGFMSNRGRQIVCSFLVRDMGIDWRMGAEWFETCLLDYDPCSNYGNWTYGAGVGNDPREDRYFSIPKQAKTYDPEGEFVAYWLPELQALPKERRNFPGNAYIRQIVPLKFESASQGHNHSEGEQGRQRKAYRRWQTPSVRIHIR